MQPDQGSKEIIQDLMERVEERDEVSENENENENENDNSRFESPMGRSSIEPSSIFDESVLREKTVTHRHKRDLISGSRASHRAPDTLEAGPHAAPRHGALPGE